VGATTGGDKALGFDEFVNLLSLDLGVHGIGAVTGSSTEQKSADDELRLAFDTLDVDGDGFISAADLQTALRAQGDDFNRIEIEQMIFEIDTGTNKKTKKICFADFKAALSP
jgi:Ca2+-binding EF-hand superfamily protein